MILPIRAYGDPVLKKRAREIERGDPRLQELIDHMFQTMEAANGVGLAAPQVGLDLRLFVVHLPHDEEDPKSPPEFREVFINPVMLSEEGKLWKFNEGCLSIPDIREDVERRPQIHLRWLDMEFREHEEAFSGLVARVIQHEYDHLEGVLFTDRISPLRKRLLKKRLENIARGQVQVDYAMKFFKPRR